MSAQATTTPPTGSLGRTIAPARRVHVSQVAEFYMGGIWEWTPAGINRVTRFLEDLNIDQATYRYEERFNVWQVRCMKGSGSLKSSGTVIRQNFVNLLAKIETEYFDALETNALQLIQDDGTLTELEVHPDVRLPVHLPRTPKLPPQDLAESRFKASSHADGLSAERGECPTVTLVVPDQLRDARNIVVWQGLQARKKDFEGTIFMSPAARAAIESAYDVQIVSDVVQKVIFIGNAPSMERALKVEKMLTKLLHDFKEVHKNPRVRNVFFVEPAYQSASTSPPYTIDTREISWLNPVLARSTILDPWRFSVPEQYAIFDAGVLALRVCRFETLRNGEPNQYWSLFGPYAKNVFGGKCATRSSRHFAGLKAAKRDRTSTGPVDVGTVSNWLEDLHIAPGAVDTTLTDVEIAGSSTPECGGGEDDPVPLNFDPSKRPDVAIRVARKPSPLPGGSEASKPEAVSLLDQQDAILRNPYSTMQRAMKPSRRTINVLDPEVVELENSLQETVKPKPTSNGTNAYSNNPEFGMFVASVSSLLERIRQRYGAIRLRAELGRYFMHNMPMTARATNEPSQPTIGWTIDELHTGLETHSDFLFTKALSSWGNDADFLGDAMWDPLSGAVFFDFRFQTLWGRDLLDMVLEVNAVDYTWKLRFQDSVLDAIYVHCLAQSWDFRAALIYDRVLEYNEMFRKFAEALVGSLNVQPPELEFQHTFDDIPVGGTIRGPITIRDVRARQVRRFLHQDKKTFLDIERILPMKAKPGRDTKFRAVRGLLSRAKEEDPCAGDDQATGEFAQWFEASVSSVRLEEILKQNEDLVPGHGVDWTVQQLEQEGVFADLYHRAAEVVKGIDGVGVECNNGHLLRQKKVDDNYKY